MEAVEVVGSFGEILSDGELVVGQSILGRVDVDSSQYACVHYTFRYGLAMIVGSL